MDSTEAASDQLIYEGSYEEVFVLVHELRAGGIAVQWSPPDRERSGIIQDIVVGLVVSGTVETTRAIISRFLERHRAKVRPVDEGPDDASGRQQEQ